MITDHKAGELARKLRVLAGITALLDVAAIAAAQIGQPGAPATLAASVALTTDSAREMIAVLQSEISEAEALG